MVAGFIAGYLENGKLPEKSVPDGVVSAPGASAFSENWLQKQKVILPDSSNKKFVYWGNNRKGRGFQMKIRGLLAAKY